MCEKAWMIAINRRYRVAEEVLDGNWGIEIGSRLKQRTNHWVGVWMDGWGVGRVFGVAKQWTWRLDCRVFVGAVLAGWWFTRETTMILFISLSGLSEFRQLCCEINLPTLSFFNGDDYDGEIVKFDLDTLHFHSPGFLQCQWSYREGLVSRNTKQNVSVNYKPI